MIPPPPAVVVDSPPQPRQEQGHQHLPRRHRPRGVAQQNTVRRTAATNQHHQQNHHQHRQPQKQRIPRFALAAAERKIHLRMNLANSKLSRAIDLDEQHCRLGSSHKWERTNQLLKQNTHHPYNREHSYGDAAIEGYVEAAESYLGAIQLAEDQQGGLLSAAATNAKRASVFSSLSSSWSPSPSNVEIRATEASIYSLVPKLKRLLISSLDRVEALKKEKRQCQQHKIHKPTAMATRTRATTMTMTTPTASRYNNLPIATRVLSLSDRRKDWFRREQSMPCIGSNQRRKEGDDRRASPTTVIW